MQTQPTPVPTSRILARILRQLLLAEESFETFADLTDALKTRCARLRIHFTVDELNEAYLVVGSNHPLITSAHPRTNPKHIERIEPAPMIPRERAAEILADLHAGIRTMPELARVETDEEFEAAQERAAEMGIELRR